MKTKLKYIIIALAFAIIAACKHNPKPAATVTTTTPKMMLSDTIFNTQQWHVAYANFPGIDAIDSTGKVNGIAADIVNAIAARCQPPLQVMWQPINWNTMRQDLDNNTYHMAAALNMQTTWRSQQYIQSLPVAKVGICVAVVKNKDNRFSKIEDMNSKDIHIIMPEQSESIWPLKELLPNANIQINKENDNPFYVFDKVKNGEKDAAIYDYAMAYLYCQSNKESVKILFYNPPYAYVPIGFCFSKNHPDVAQFVNENLTILHTDGTIKRIIEKWKLPYIEAL